MQIRRFLKFLFVGIFCIFCVTGVNAVETNAPRGEITTYGNWINEYNVEQYNQQMSHDVIGFQQRFEHNVQSPGFVPVEVKLGLMFMKALGAIDKVLQSSLGRFTIIFLFIMYAFWVSLESYKLIRDSNDYKETFYEIFKKGITIAIWVLILNYGPAKIFEILISPVIAVGTLFSDLIFNTVAQSYNVDLGQNTCTAIHNYVNNNYAVTIANGENAKLMINPETAANIMCLPGRVSTYFYHAVAAGFRWMIHGFGHSLTAIAVGAVSIIIFIKCIFKYAFMTLGVVADLFLTLLMLPFTAIAEAMPATKESNYVGQVFSGLLKIFNAKKLSDVILVFINATVYFITLSIVIAICAVLLSMSIDLNGSYSTATGMITLLTGCFVLYLANKADELATQLGGKIDNSFGKQLQGDAKTLWGDAKKIGNMIFKTWLKK